MITPCRFCGGDASAPNHPARCDGRQGRAEADLEPLEPAAGLACCCPWIRGMEPGVRRDPSCPIHGDPRASRSSS